MNTSSRRTIRLLDLAPIGAGVLACLLILATTLNRGFNLTDEGFYLLGYRHPEDVTLSLTQFHHVVGTLLGLGRLPVIAYRVACVLLGIASAALLGVSTAFAWDRDHGRDRTIHLVLFAILGGLVQFSWGPRTLSYNHLSGALCFFEVSVLILLAVRPGGTVTGVVSMAASLALGLALGAHFLIKSTTGLTMGLVTVGWISWLALRARRVDWRLPVGIGLGGCLIVLWFFSRAVEPRTWLTDIAQVHHTMSAFYSLKSLWLGTVSTSLGALKRVLPVAGAVALTIVASRRLRRDGRSSLALLCEGVGLVGVALYVVARGAYAGGQAHLERMWIPHFLGLVMVTAAWFDQQARQLPRPELARRGWIVIGLAALPPAAAFGSSNMVSFQMLFHLAPWYVALGLMLGDLLPSTAPLVRHGVPWTLGLVVFLQVYGGQIDQPFHTHGRMAEQTAPLPAFGDAAAALRVHPDIASLVAGTRSLLDDGGIREGDRIWMLHDCPGLVYLLGGRAPQSPWLYGAQRELRSLSCVAIKRTPGDAAREYLLLSGELEADMRACLADAGRPFDGFRYLGQVSPSPCPSDKLTTLRVFARSLQ